MANSVAIVAKSGAGKSTSYGNIPEINIKGLNPKETFLINLIGKPLPFRGWKSSYIEFKGSEGNYLVSRSSKDIISAIDFIEQKRPDIKNIVIDDN